jgi:hypothetical protein
MTLAHELPGDRTVWQAIFQKIKPLMKNALSQANIRKEDMSWTEMRWDVSDITVSWPKNKPTRNIHAWLRSPAWPRFFLEIEGAAWEDDESDEEKPQRRVRLFPFPGQPSLIVISGLAGHREIDVRNRGELSEGLSKLASDLKSCALNNTDPVYRLKPKPDGVGSLS